MKVNFFRLIVESEIFSLVSTFFALKLLNLSLAEAHSLLLIDNEHSVEHALQNTYWT